MKTLGIDEAGRGPVLGSMFVGGVLVKDENMEDLQNLGVKDSKLLSDSKRESLVPKIKEKAEEIYAKEVTGQQIDELRKNISLNKIELEVFLKIIEESKPDKVIIDLPERNSEKYKAKVRARLGEDYKDLEIVAEHKADVNYPIVSAASIIAKSNREKNVRKIEEKYDEEISTGYPHDKKTINFLEEYVAKNGVLPEEARESWSTAKRILKQNSQKKVDDF